MPAWVEVIDFTTGNNSGTSQAVRACGLKPLPPWCWDKWTTIRDRYGVTYQADRRETMRRLAATRREGYEDQEWLPYMSRLRANMLGLDMDGWTPLAPGSYIVGHRKPLAGNTAELQIREMAWRW